jgi:hypothetical protein
MASRRGRIGDYTRAKLDAIIDGKVTTSGGGGSGDITGVTAGDGLDGGGTTGDVTLDIDYAGTDSVIRAAADGTGITVASDDQMLVSDTDDSNNVKYVNVSQLPSGAPTDAQYVTLATDSDLSAERVLTAGDGVTMADGGAGSTITVAVDYAGADSVIMAATDGTSATVATNDKVILKDESDGSDTVKYVNISQLGAGVVAGSDTEIQYNNNGLFGATSSFSFYSSSFGGEATLQLRHDVVSDARKDEHPTMVFTRSGPLLEYDDMNLGKISFRGGNSNNDDHEYAYMIAQASDTSDANEGGYIKFYCAAGGIDPGDASIYNLLSIGGEDEARMSAVVVNQAGINCDFRVESDGETHKLFVDASANSIGINQSSPDNSVGLDINDDALFTDDKKLYFGTGQDAYIQYDEATSDKLIMSGAHGGTYFSGSSIHVGPLGAAGTTYGPSTTTPVTAFDTITDLGTTTGDGTACDMISDGQMGGQMIRMGVFESSVNVVGELVSLSRGRWYAADADTAADLPGALNLLIAIAMAVDGDADEGLVLLRGIARIPSTLFTGTAPIGNHTGKPLYASETEGEITLDIPTTSGAIVRVIGYLLDASSSDGLIYFNPDNTWVTIA